MVGGRTQILDDHQAVVLEHHLGGGPRAAGDDVAEHAAVARLTAARLVHRIALVRAAVAIGHSRSGV